MLRSHTSRRAETTRPGGAPTSPAPVSESAIREHVLRFHEEYDAVVVWERDGGIVYWSPAAARLYGWTLEEAMGRAAHDLLGTKALPPNIEAEVEAGFWEGDLERRARDGRGIVVEAQETLIAVEGRSLVVEASWDITVRRAAERALAESERRLAALLQAARQAHDAIVISDRLNGIQFWNRGAEELYGWKAAETVGRRPRDLFEADLPADHERLARDSWEGEVTHLTRDGRRLIVESRQSVLRQGDSQLVFQTSRDVTQQKRVEQLRDSFIAMLSHELRTPVTSIYAGAQLLRRGSLDESTREAVIDDVAGETERLREMVENLLVLARAERGAFDLEIEPILLREVAAPIVAAARANSSARFELRLPDGLPLVAADRAALELVLRNLVDNAAKYGGADPTVTVSASPSVRGESIEIVVADDGPGVPASERERIFELFYREKSTTRRASGSGIGLFVVRALIEAMHGHVKLDSGRRRGTRVEVILPSYSTDETDDAEGSRDFVGT
jgi:two-component system, chemotaxis family, CheB/CheR fusion protein